MENYYFGWIPEHDTNSELFKFENRGNKFVLDSLELDMPSVYDQGTIGSCTANAISNLIQKKSLKIR